MLFLHCGLPKTGTTTLQSALARNRDRLEEVGVVYPDEWSWNGGNNHNGLDDLLRAARRSRDGSGAPFDELRDVLRASAGNDVLLSSEALTTWVLREKTVECLLALLAAAQEAMPVTCLWTMRRLDEYVHSAYLEAVVKGGTPPPSSEIVDWLSPDRLFGNMRRVQDAVGGNAVYVKYDSGGGHNEELLRAFGIPLEVAGSVERELADRPRLNVSRSHKQVAALLNADALSARAGVPLAKAVLQDVFDRDGFRFEDDRPCELIGYEARRDLHERALAAARDEDFPAYLEFFESAGVDTSLPTPLESEILTDDDLRRLVAHLSAEGLPSRKG